MNQRAPIEFLPVTGQSTRRSRFLAVMERIMPWPELEGAVQQVYERNNCAARRFSARRMLRVHLLQHWFSLSDAALVEALHDSTTLRQFAQLTTHDPVPDEADIASFRRLLMRHGVGDLLQGAVRRQLTRYGVRIRDAVVETPRIVELELVAGGPREDAAAAATPPPPPPVRGAPPTHPAAVEMALTALGVGVFEWEPAGPHRLSERCRQIIGLSPDDEPTQERLLALVHPDDLPLVGILCDSMRPDGDPGFSFEVRLIRPDGALRWVHVSGRTVFFETGGRRQARSYGTMLDITERRNTERRLYERDSQLSTFFEGAPSSIATFDREMRFIEVSRQYAEDRGMTAAGLIGRCLYEAFPQIPAHWRAAHARCLAGATERCDLDIFVRPDGRREWVRWELRPWYREDHVVGGLVLVSEVITHSVRAQRRLHESEARLELAIRAGALGIYDYDLIANTTSWDQRVRELWGVNPAENVTYETFISGVAPADRGAALKALEDSLGPAGNGTHASEYRVIHRGNGTVRWVASTGTVFFERGRAVRLIGIVQDITARKQAELAATRSAAELRKADQRKDDFLATLSHELRNPLSPIRTAAHLLASPSLNPEQLAWARQVIQRQVAHMASMLDDLLDIARITRGKLHLRRERVCLAAVVESALEAARPLIDKKHHHLEISLGELAALELAADPLRLSQVLSNLLSNAAKYTDPGGCIEICALLEAPGTLQLAVKDNGIGIPPEALERIFDMFWQVQGDAGHSQGGLGIGLAFVKSLVELHHGTIEARSEGKDRGSELIVRLPLAGADEMDAPRQAAAAPAPLKERCRVLLADDNRDAADSLALLLRLSAHEVRVVHDGRAALALAESFRPDVALLDISMPEVDGYGVARALRQASWAAGLRLVALTGRGQEEDKLRANAAGFDHHLTKPVNPEALEQLLHARQAAAAPLWGQ